MHQKPTQFVVPVGDNNVQLVASRTGLFNGLNSVPLKRVCDHATLFQGLENKSKITV